MKILLERYNFIIILRKKIKQIIANLKIAIFAGFSILSVKNNNEELVATFKIGYIQ
jgi:hypothetical protein